MVKDAVVFTGRTLGPTITSRDVTAGVVVLEIVDVTCVESDDASMNVGSQEIISGVAIHKMSHSDHCPDRVRVHAKNHVLCERPVE